MAGDWCVGDSTPALPAEVVDDSLDPEPAAPGKAVGDEVQGLPLVRPLRDRHWCHGSERPLAAAALAVRHPLLAIEAIELLPVCCTALPRQHDVQPSVARAPAFTQ